VTELEAYLRLWHGLVAAWSALAEEPGQQDELLRRALDEGVTALGLPDATDAPEPLVERACAVALIRRHGSFDAARYAYTNPHVDKLGADPLEHFCEHGWDAAHNPNLDFDVWWYTTEYLDATDERANSYVHYLILGRFEGLLPLPVQGDHPPTSYPAGHAVRRVCLFAAYDVDGIVDDYVLAYLTELSQYADIYYLADSPMQEAELAKLRDVTVAAWSIPHGRYDFGSYSMLAEELVGWDVIETYDEMLLANDSCYLLRPLDEVFARMDATTCDWWGMQMTARFYDEDEYGSDLPPLPMEEAQRRFLPRSVMKYNEFVHVGSYFLCFRRPVIADQGFRRRLADVVKQRAKILIVYKYETGTTQYLVGQGYQFATYIPDLYPFHPAYGRYTWELIRRGFPFLKRQFLGDNPFDTPDLVEWKERVLEIIPDAPVEMFDRNLHRVMPADKIARSFAIRTLPDGTIDYHRALTRRAFRRLDRSTPKFDHWWAFPVCGYDHTFAGNERAVFEIVRDDPSVKKIILTRSLPVEVEGENVEIVPLTSPEGQHFLARSRQIFVKHGPSINALWPVSPQLHNIVNLWHGIPLKRFGMSALEINDEAYDWAVKNHGGSRAIIASSKMDALAMNASFYPASYPDFWITGLPRNDFILRADDDLPSDLRASVDQLRAEVGDRRLVLFLPTFKDAQEDAYYEFSEDELARLQKWAEQHHAVLGIREHMADEARTYSHLLGALGPVNVSSRRYPDLEVLYRAADALVSDYSSCLVDFMMTGKPMISFAYDYERYAGEERGLMYQLDKVLPGPVCRDFDSLIEALDHVFDERTPEQVATYEWRRNIFFDHLDDQASWRVVQRVKALGRGAAGLS
jgi:CDP-glycerol glycerophosphotransferase (TagB/SpsB family)